MDAIHICSGGSIGPLKLGMDRNELEQALASVWNALDQTEGLAAYPDYADPGEEGVRYMAMRSGLVVLVSYADGHAVDISINRQFANFVQILVFGMDVFRSEAADMIAQVQRQTDGGDMKTDDFDFRFSTLGLRFWREHLEDPEDDISPSKFDFVAVMQKGRN